MYNGRALAWMSTKQGPHASWLNMWSNQDTWKRNTCAGSERTAKKEVEVVTGRTRLVAYWAPCFHLGRWKSLGDTVTVQQWGGCHYCHWIVHYKWLKCQVLCCEYCTTAAEKKWKGEAGLWCEWQAVGTPASDLTLQPRSWWPVEFKPRFSELCIIPASSVLTFPLK